jgi:hypothetical protein
MAFNLAPFEKLKTKRRRIRWQMYCKDYDGLFKQMKVQHNIISG